MAWVWHKPHDLNCEICSIKPEVKKLKGCPPYEKAEQPHIYPPGRITDYPGKRYELERCPVLYVTEDLMIAERYRRAGPLPIEWIERLPNPLIEAVDMFEVEMGHRDRLKIKEAYGNG